MEKNSISVIHMVMQLEVCQFVLMIIKTSVFTWKKIHRKRQHAKLEYYLDQYNVLL